MRIKQISDYMNTNIVDLANMVCNSRPLPNREYDQIYMHMECMIEQAIRVGNQFSGKDVVFLGDGDGMAMLFTILIENRLIEPFKSILVMDFDERILNNAQKIVYKTEYGKSNVSFELYNIINPIPCKLLHKYNAFYINPPYGSKNDGLSCKLWLYRCFELCKKDLCGCLILPNDNIRVWTRNNLRNIFEFLLEYGLIPYNVINECHSYFLDDDPSLLSSSILVSGNIEKSNPYEQKEFTAIELKNLYGSTRPIPQYILEDVQDSKGRKDFNWQFGSNIFGRDSE